MVTIPMRTKKPMRTSELGGINRSGGSQTLQTLRENRPAPGRAQPAPVRSRSTPPAPPPRPVSNRPHPPATGKVLQKGQKISLSQLDPGLDQIEVGLGWDLGPNGQGYDLDVEAFLLDGSGRVPGDSWFVFYNQPVSPDGAVRLLEAGRPDAGPGDDESIQIHLRKVDPGVAKIAFIVTINEARAHGFHFGNVSNAYVRIVNRATRRELVRFQLTDYYSNVCSMVVGEIYRYKDEWRFNPVGSGTGDDLEGLCVRYGVEV